MTNVFKIRHGKETHVYRTEAPSDKRSLLSSFRHVAEELTARKRKEREGEHERRKTLWSGGGDVRPRLFIACLSEAVTSSATLSWIRHQQHQIGCTSSRRRALVMGAHKKRKPSAMDDGWVTLLMN